jgi:hypothetical protein
MWRLDFVNQRSAQSIWSPINKAWYLSLQPEFLMTDILCCDSWVTAAVTRNLAIGDLRAVKNDHR